jgi:hypothetical protein
MYRAAAGPAAKTQSLSRTCRRGVPGLTACVQGDPRSARRACEPCPASAPCPQAVIMIRVVRRATLPVKPTALDRHDQSRPPSNAASQSLDRHSSLASRRSDSDTARRFYQCLPVQSLHVGPGPGPARLSALTS